MNGVHDMGGMMAFGPVEPEADEPPFHAEWEGRVLGLNLAANATGAWNLDMGRHAREALPPAEYLSSTYYEIWLSGLERLVVKYGLLSEAELAAGTPLEPAKPRRRVLTAEMVPQIPLGGGGMPTARRIDTAARFSIGDTAVTRNLHPKGHTRLPAYARGKRGVIEKVHGAHVFADAHAAGLGEAPQWLYTVRFSGTEIWGEDSDPTLSTSIEAWESYLDLV
jgi:nitrile hydratase subunit beta